MKDIDWNNAPGDATHASYIIGNTCWYKYSDGVWSYLYNDDFYSNACGWENVTGEPVHKPLIKRIFAWSGDGLPPVGIKCEIASDDLERWYECLILAHHNGLAVMFCEGWTCDGGYRDMDYDAYPPERFRPIPNPEQIAAEERSRECDKIYGIISSVERPGNKSDMSEALYDAGYRKGESK